MSPPSWSRDFASPKARRAVQMPAAQVDCLRDHPVRFVSGTGVTAIHRSAETVEPFFCR